MGIGDTDTALREAVVLESPSVLPQNEGKLVMFHGTPEMTAPVFDSELGLTLQTVKAVRYKEIYACTRRADDEDVWDWSAGGTKTLFGAAKAGEFSLAEEILMGMPVEGSYIDFDVQEAGRYAIDQPSDNRTFVYVLPEGAYYYDKASGSRLDNSLAGRSAYSVSKDREGTAAYRYSYFDASQHGEMTFVGRQVGNMLLESGVDGVSHVNAGVMTLEELVSSNKSMLAWGSGIGMACGAGLMILSVRMGNRRAERPQKKKQNVG